MPQREEIKTPAEILKDTVDVFMRVFGERKIDTMRWEQAENKALALYGIPGLDCRIISPALMEAALKAVEQDHVQEAINRNEQYKREPVTENRIALMLLQWTRARMGEQRPIMQYMPSNKDAYQYGWKLGCADSVIERHLNLLRCYINDYRYSKQTGKQMGSTLYISNDKNELTLKIA